METILIEDFSTFKPDWTNIPGDVKAICFNERGEILFMMRADIMPLPNGLDDIYWGVPGDPLSYLFHDYHELLRISNYCIDPKKTDWKQTLIIRPEEPIVKVNQEWRYKKDNAVHFKTTSLFNYEKEKAWYVEIWTTYKSGDIHKTFMLEEFILNECELVKDVEPQPEEKPANVVCSIRIKEGPFTYQLQAPAVPATHGEYRLILRRNALGIAFVRWEVIGDNQAASERIVPAGPESYNNIRATPALKDDRPDWRPLFDSMILPGEEE